LLRDVDKLLMEETGLPVVVAMIADLRRRGGGRILNSPRTRTRHLRTGVMSATRAVLSHGRVRIPIHRPHQWVLLRSCSTRCSRSVDHRRQALPKSGRYRRWLSIVAYPRSSPSKAVRGWHWFVRASPRATRCARTTHASGRSCVSRIPLQRYEALESETVRLRGCAEHQRGATRFVIGDIMDVDLDAFRSGCWSTRRHDAYSSGSPCSTAACSPGRRVEDSPAKSS